MFNTQPTNNNPTNNSNFRKADAFLRLRVLVPGKKKDTTEEKWFSKDIPLHISTHAQAEMIRAAQEYAETNPGEQFTFTFTGTIHVPLEEAEKEPIAFF